MKIICVGHNYSQHNEEMGRSQSNLITNPVIFMKPDSALLKDDKPFFIPDFSENVHYELELVVKINRLGKNIAEKFASRYYDEVTVGIDFTARDLQNDLKAKNLPWEIAKGFDNSAAVGKFVSKSKLSSIENGWAIELQKNSVTVQKASTSDMIHSVDKIVAYASQFFTLKVGDLIFTGTPAGVGAVAIDDRLEGYLCGDKLFDFYVR